MSELEKDTNGFYSAFKQDYLYLYPDHIAHYKVVFEWLISRLDLKPSAKVYDACCGVGIDLLFFAQRGYEVRGSDISTEMVYSAKELLTQTNPQIEIQVLDVLDLDTNCEKYDLVLFCGNTLGHLSSIEQTMAVRKLIGITKPGGHLLLDFRNGISYFRKKSLFECRGLGFNRKRKELYCSFYTMKHPSKNDLKYDINAQIYVLNLNTFNLRHKMKRIQGNYVLPDNVMREIKERDTLSVNDFLPNTGLPCLETFLVTV